MQLPFLSWILLDFLEKYLKGLKIKSDRIRTVTLGSNFTVRIFLIGGGLVGGKGSQDTI
jgi:hypothetical protein